MPPQQNKQPDFIPAEPDFIPAETSAPESTPAPPQSLMSTLRDNWHSNTDPLPNDQNSMMTGAENIARGLARGTGHLLAHPMASVREMGEGSLASGVTPYGTPNMAPTGNRERDENNQQAVSMARDKQAEGGKQMAAHPAYALGEASAPLLMGAGIKALTEIPGELADAGSFMRSKAIGDPDAAALRGMGVRASSPKGLSTINSVKGARPYLQGAQSLEDLQSRIAPAKDEIWQPYRQAVEGIGDRPVKGPDGMTTVSALEKERLELSAINRGLKTGDPQALQLAQQKGLSQAQALAREDAIKAALDPELESTGIKPTDIRKTFGNVSQVGGRISGKTTLVEKPQPFGLGKMADIKLGNPRTWLGSPVQGARDIIAGRPLWRGNPTDVSIREGFRMAGEKPDLGTFAMPKVRGLLQAPLTDFPLGPAPQPGEMPGSLMDAERFPAQNVGEARVIRNSQGRILPKAARNVEFPDESGKLPFGRNQKGQILSRTPTRQAFMTSGKDELEDVPPISGPGVLRRRIP